MILPDGRIWTVDAVGSSGSRALDTAGGSVFGGGFVRPFPEGEPQADIDNLLHYVLAHRDDQPLAAGYTPALSKSPFTITNDPVKSPILETIQMPQPIVALASSITTTVTSAISV